MANTDSNRDSVMTDPDSNEYDNEWSSRLPQPTFSYSGRSYVIEVLEGNPQVCYDKFCMDKTIFRHLCNELKRLHL
ncbi:hypothetical protein CFP56_040926 [Quercus suber]|uniref:DUF8040 domain-containing protein n=1 Tax=Quercus suber TaxID=58331 RepID=A0AAW0IWL8_QUESU